MHVANQVYIWQHKAENQILTIAQELKEGLCISHNRAMTLAKTMLPTTNIISKWKE
jgi:hypothetical protein